MPEEKLSQSLDSLISFNYDDRSNLYNLDENLEVSDDKFIDIRPNDNDVDVNDNDDEYDHDHDDGVDNSSFRPVIDIKNSKKKALRELRSKVEDAIINNHIYGIESIDILEDMRDVKIWGVPLLPSKGYEATDIVLMKFLKAKNYRVSKAFRMLQRTMGCRRDLKIDKSFNEEFDDGLENMWEMQGRDHGGRPVCYYKPGVFENNELRKRCLGTEEKCPKYMRWRLQCVERAVRMIIFREGAAHSIVQIMDLKNAHSMAMKELHHSINISLMSLIHEIYPDLVHKNLLINVPFWYMAVYAPKMNLITKRTKNKYVFVRPLKVTVTLLKLFPPEIISVQYGGLKRENDNEFSTDDIVLEAIVRANWTKQIFIPVYQADVKVTWDLTVVGFNVTSKEEFVPNDGCSYKVLIQREKKMQGPVRNSFHISEPGNIIITIANGTFKKRRVFYRHRIKPSIPSYGLAK